MPVTTDAFYGVEATKFFRRDVLESKEERVTACRASMAEQSEAKGRGDREMRAPVLAYISRPSSGGRIGFCPCTIFTGRLARTTKHRTYLR